MYPLTVSFTIPIINYNDQNMCSGDLVESLVMDNGATWTNNNPSIGLPLSGTGSIPSFIAIGNSTTATITYMNGCSEGSFNFNILPQSNLTSIESNYNGQNIGCNGASDGSIDLTVIGVEPYTYIWSNGEMSEDIDDLSAGTYTVLVIDDNACEETLTVTLEEPEALEAFVSVVDVSCYGGSDGSAELTVLGGTGPYEIEDFSNLSAGTYTTTVIDANGCSIILDFDIIEPEASEVIVSGVNVYDCDLTSYLYASTLEDGVWEYYGNSSNNVIFGDPFSLTTSVTVPEYGTYAFQYTVCEVSDMVLVTFSCPITIPNVLTVNGDGNNDFFIIENLHASFYLESILTIYNRWGRVVYFDSSYGLGPDVNWWDGTTNNTPFSSISLERDFEANKRKTVSQGVYYYSLELFHKGNHKIKDHHTGYLHIIR